MCREIEFIKSIESKFSGKRDKKKEMFTDKGIEHPFILEMDGKEVGSMFLYFNIGNNNPSGLVWLMYIRAYDLKKGYGSKMLSLLCKEADSKCISIYIEPSPYKIKGNISVDNLINWYRRFGFDSDNGGITMIRKHNLVQQYN